MSAITSIVHHNGITRDDCGPDASSALRALWKLHPPHATAHGGNARIQS
jgi:hypothetical protein